MQLVLTSFVLAIASQLVSAQYPALPTDMTVVESKVNAEVKISYKEVRAPCYSSPGNTVTDVVTRLNYASKQPESSPTVAS